MADPEHLAILKRGVAEWNAWRADHPDQRVDLSEANLSEARLREADLSNANLSSADLSEADLSRARLNGAHLNGANFFKANLSGANLSLAYLPGTSLRQALLSEAYLHGAFLRKADFSKANFSGADLSETSLGAANLSGANLSQVNLANARLVETIFLDTDLSTAIGLESCQHEGPSSLDYRTLAASGTLPLSFLRGVGLPDRFIEYLPSLFGGDPIQYYACFISYSSEDHAVAEQLYKDLRDNRVRCWFAPKNLKPGAYFRAEIDEAIHTYDKLLLILSEHSIISPWVADEVEAGLERERRTGEKVLFPIQIDDAARNAGDWAAALRRRRHIGDMRKWNDPDAYRQAFTDFLNALRTEKDAPPSA